MNHDGTKNKRRTQQETRKANMNRFFLLKQTKTHKITDKACSKSNKPFSLASQSVKRVHLQSPKSINDFISKQNPIP